MKKIILILGCFGMLGIGIYVHVQAPQNTPTDTLEYAHKLNYAVTAPNVSMPTVVLAQNTTSEEPTPTPLSFWDIVKENWGALLMAFLAFLETVIRLTPSDRDNSIFNLIKKILDAIIPNKATFGGYH